MTQMQRVFSIFISLIVLTIALSASEHYLLPENKSDLIRTLKLKIERADTIVIITKRLDSNTLSRSIEKRVSAHANMQLITTDLSTAAYYAKYKNTTVQVPNAQDSTETFTLNILLIDKSDICFSSLPFDESILKREIGQVICTTNREEIKFAETIRDTYMERFEAY